MQRLNGVIEQYGRWAELKEYTERIDAYIESDFSQSLENSKALLESLSKQICKEKGVEIGAKPNFSKVLKTAFSAIGYTGSTPVIQITSALATIGQQMGELRNEIGITSHGKTMEDLRERNSKVDEMTKELLIDTTSIIASFLIRHFENENPRIASRASEQNVLLLDNPDFNDAWDDDYGEFAMSDYSYTASEILFYTDYKAYLTELNAFKEDKG